MAAVAKASQYTIIISISIALSLALNRNRNRNRNRNGFCTAVKCKRANANVTNGQKLPFEQSEKRTKTQQQLTFVAIPFHFIGSFAREVYHSLETVSLLVLGEKTVANFVCVLRGSQKASYTK